MFGDPLSQAECGVLIDQVSQCKLPFQCAQYELNPLKYTFLFFKLSLSADAQACTLLLI